MSETAHAIAILNPKPSSGDGEVTIRGFRIDKFIDRYGSACSLQKSSLASEDAIWLGIDDAKPQIMASHARALADSGDKGAKEALTAAGCPAFGWIPWPIPDEVLMSTRMHLTQEQVRALLPALQHFAETGELPA